MKKDNRIRRKKEFTRVYRQGKSFANKYLVLYIKPRGEGQTRFGFAVGKKYGNAVKRNRLRRQLREISRLHLDVCKEGFDVVIIPRQPARGRDFDTLWRALRHLFHKAGIFRKE